MTKLIAIAFVLMLCLSIGAQTAPTTSLNLPEGPIKVKITAVKGIVQARKNADEKWEKATEGLELAEGAELRTGPRSAVQFMIGDDQVVTLDRLGTIQILRADFVSGKVFTDLGMKYGRTRYDIETAAREHDAKVRSPSSVLAVRGTRFISQDQPPFAPAAVSLEGRVMFRDAKKLVAFGGRGQGKTKIDANSDSAASKALGEARPPTQLNTGLSAVDVARNIGNLPSASAGLGVLPSLEQFRAYSKLINLGSNVSVFIKEQLFFGMNWTGAPGSDVAIQVISPQGDIIDKLHPTLQKDPVFAVYQDSPPADASGTGGPKNVTFTTQFPAGKYTITSTLTNPGAPGKNVSVLLDAIKDPTGQANDFAQLGPNGGPFQFQLSEKSPSQTVTVDAQPAPPVPAAGAKTSSKKKHR